MDRIRLYRRQRRRARVWVVTESVLWAIGATVLVAFAGAGILGLR